MKPKNPIYLDCQATTPIDRRVVSAMTEYMLHGYGNPISSHYAGREAMQYVDRARGTIAQFIGVDHQEVFFTSGATESINIVLQGLAYGLRKKGNHIITTAIEHKAVLDTLRNLEKNGFSISYANVMQNGKVDFEHLKSLISTDTIMVAIGHVNNEIGVIQNIPAIGSLAHEHGAVMFSDCAQSFGKIPIDMQFVDAIAFSGHKIYGPMGVGGFVLRKKHQPDLTKVIYGGDQESGLRAGTHNVPGIVGLEEAVRICQEEMENDATRIEAMRDHLKDELASEIENIVFHGAFDSRIYNNLYFSIPDVSSEMVIRMIGDQVAFSARSACMSAAGQPSHVLLALGVDYETAGAAFRVSLGRFSTNDEIDIFARLFIGTIRNIREIKNF